MAYVNQYEQELEQEMNNKTLATLVIVTALLITFICGAVAGYTLAVSDFKEAQHITEKTGQIK